MSKIGITTPSLSITFDGEELDDEFLENEFDVGSAMYALSFAIMFMIHSETTITIDKDELTYKNTYQNEHMTSQYMDVELSSKFSKSGGVLVFSDGNADKLNEMGVFKYDGANLLLVIENEYEGENFVLTVTFAKSNS